MQKLKNKKIAPKNITHKVKKFCRCPWESTKLHFMGKSYINAMEIDATQEDPKPQASTSFQGNDMGSNYFWSSHVMAI